MELETWEKEAFKELSKLYNNFFEKLSELSKECFRTDAHKIFSKNVKQLPKEQENEIYKYFFNNK